MIDELSNRTRKYIQMRTLAKYNINIDPKTLKYYNDATEKAKPTTQDETILVDTTRD